MSAFLRGNTYWYKFRWSVKTEKGDRESYLVRRSARTSSKREAEKQEADHRSALRRAEVHPLDPYPKVKPPAPERPTLLQYAEVVMRHVELHRKVRTVGFYRECLKRIGKFESLARASLDVIAPELIDAYIEWRLRAKRGNSHYAVNAELRTLRRILRFAQEKNVIRKAPTIHELDGERCRSRILSHAEEAAYLRAASPKLRAVAVLAVDTGLRPNSELFPLRWEDVGEDFIQVIRGKSANAARIVPLTPRARALLSVLRSANGERGPWVFPASRSATGHLMTIQKVHAGAARRAGLALFPFYAWRHTFGTRCAEAGMDKYAIARLMGHSSPSVAEKFYIKVSRQYVERSFERFVEYQAREAIQALPDISGWVQ
jgi:integrase